jgi:Putative transmembrane protein (PGPGW)
VHSQLTMGIRSIAAWSQRLRKIAVAAIGACIVIFGVGLVISPFPASLVIVFGLTILGKEFHWARKLLQPLQKRLGQLSGLARQVLTRPSPLAVPRGDPESP